MQVATKRKGNPSVMEFALDEEKFEQRSQEGCDDVYRDPIYVRAPGPSAENDATQVGLSAAASTPVVTMTIDRGSGASLSSTAPKWWLAQRCHHTRPPLSIENTCSGQRRTRCKIDTNAWVEERYDPSDMRRFSQNLIILPGSKPFEWPRARRRGNERTLPRTRSGSACERRRARW